MHFRNGIESYTYTKLVFLLSVKNIVVVKASDTPKIGQ